MATQNPIYNDLLRRWAEQGHPCDPRCEECDCDLTGEDVVDVGTGWSCVACSEADEGYVMSENALRDAERKQMGL